MRPLCVERDGGEQGDRTDKQRAAEVDEPSWWKSEAIYSVTGGTATPHSMLAALGAGVFPGRRPRHINLTIDAAAESGRLSIAESR
jgi:hypothetical protein